MVRAMVHNQLQERYKEMKAKGNDEIVKKAQELAAEGSAETVDEGEAKDEVKQRPPNSLIDPDRNP